MRLLALSRATGATGRNNTDMGMNDNGLPVFETDWNDLIGFKAYNDEF